MYRYRIYKEAKGSWWKDVDADAIEVKGHSVIFFKKGEIIFVASSDCFIERTRY